MFRPSVNGSYPPSPQQSWYPMAQTGAETVPSGGIPMNSESRPYSLQQGAPSNGSEISVLLQNKSTEELQKLLTNQEAYMSFLHSLDSVRQLWTELLNRNIELAKRNLEKDSDMFQLRNQIPRKEAAVLKHLKGDCLYMNKGVHKIQGIASYSRSCGTVVVAFQASSFYKCTIIRTTELAAAQERFNEAHKQEMDLKAMYSPAVLLERLQDSVLKVDEESDNMYQQLLLGEINMTEFLQNYRKLRILYHKQTLTRLAAKTTIVLPG